MCPFKHCIYFVTIFFSLMHMLLAYHTGFYNYHQSHRDLINSPNFRRPLRQIQPDNFLNGFDWNARQNRRRSPQNDAIFFQDDDDFNPNAIPVRPWPTTPPPQPTSTVAVPGMGTTKSPCEQACLITPEYNPVCGTDGMTYSNERRLTCAIDCGKRISRAYYGRCTRLQ